MKRVLPFLGSAVLVLVLAQAQTPVAAQMEPEKRPVAQVETPPKTGLEDQLPVLVNAPSEQHARVIRVRNVRLDTMAHWLDPSYTELPVAFQAPLQDRELAAQIGQTIQPGRTLVKMTKGLIPAGIDSIVAIAPQNMFLAYGSRQALDELEHTVSLLDHPLRQIEIEMQVVQAESADLETLATNPREAAMQQGQIETSLIPARPNWNQQLKTLVQAGKAKVLTSPRILAVNSMVASLKTAQSHETTLQLKAPQDDLTLAQTLQNLPAPLAVTEGTRFEVTPTVNGNDLITMFLNAERVLGLTVGDKPEVPLNTAGAIKTTFNVHDGDTVMLLGLKTSWFDAKAPKPDAPVAVFLTSTIVRQIGESK